MEIKFISLILNNQDPQSQNPNYETSNTKDCNRYDSKDTETQLLQFPTLNQNYYQIT